ncbi:lysozyme inhibitor LprI family protein [Vibrio coralliilyticus]|uniref:lysozyme inhibitor LprI family protein n=1 Tax=Vibrio coralliilyticus TaxID=190893 RepID=UPI001E459324|nr:lysozyme inhibitor LprI family protein [Vibrio coralliilyticus]MCC2524661.1 lysozyme inhibitor LprI family protein [Vibrio coralliilyticus]
MKIFKLFSLLLMFPFSLYAQSFEERPTDDFLSLSEFSSVDEFEQYIDTYVQDCLDHSYGGSFAVRCFVSYEIWDRELNNYYQLLYKSLNDDGQKSLKNSQLSWLKTRDKAIEFNSFLLDERYNDKVGTMYIVMRADDADQATSSIVKHRALLIKSWLEYQRDSSYNERF